MLNHTSGVWFVICLSNSSTIEIMLIQWHWVFSHEHDVIHLWLVKLKHWLFKFIECIDSILSYRIKHRYRLVRDCWTLRTHELPVLLQIVIVLWRNHPCSSAKASLLKCSCWLYFDPGLTQTWTFIMVNVSWLYSIGLVVSRGCNRVKSWWLLRFSILKLFCWFKAIW